MKNASSNRSRPLPRHGYFGLALVMIFWALNWGLPGLRTHWGFFPLWLGYILLLDSLVYLRSGSSQVKRSILGFLSLFLVSAPCWWLFEFLNEKANYWTYSGRSHFNDLEFFLWASLSFSTVIPALFETAEFISTFTKIKNAPPWIRVSDSGATPMIFFVLGWFLLAVFWLWPQYGAVFLWMSLYLILDPVNIWLGHRSILSFTAKRNWRPVWSLWIASLLCGFFWEMWNYHSYPKWFYQVPYIDFWYVFEMPLLGYLGYLPFSLEVFAVYHLVSGVLRRKQLQADLRL